ncbi:MAG: hypothetical protein DI634_09485 [Kocuria palustris]|nr:MAG: hypothetical protein DI634_09485 [Kocuria palustris]
MTSPVVRPPTRDELPDYYRVLPYANGLPHWEPADAAWHGGPEPWPAPRHPATEEQLAQWAAEDAADPAFHPVGVFEDGRCVGGSATISFQVTVPGPRPLPMAGVTATGVIATHRRRGHLSAMMRVMFDDALTRHEPLAMLSASEGSIYGRFGFSPATYRTRIEIDRHEARFLPAADDTGRLELVRAETARTIWPVIHERVRLTRVGELTPQPGRWDRLTDEAAGQTGPLRYLIHQDRNGRPDGIANFRLPWSATREHAGTLVVEALEATTPEAYRAMWRLLLDFDLTKKVVAPGRPRTEPLAWMLTSPRAVRITRQSDNLWTRILDLPAALVGRRYQEQDRLRLRLDDDHMCPDNNGTWALDTRNGEPTCETTGENPDVVLTIRALSSLYLGGMSTYDLATAGAITPVDAHALSRLHRLFATDPEPHNSFAF